jgi:hypothetical protein
MTPPKPELAVVVIRWIVGMEVVMAVQAGPIDRPMLATHGAAGGNHELQPAGHLKGSVGQEPVVPRVTPMQAVIQYSANNTATALGLQKRGSKATRAKACNTTMNTTVPQRWAW